jgi:hypothetical protein
MADRCTGEASLLARMDSALYLDDKAVAAVRDSWIGIRADGRPLLGNGGELRLGPGRAAPIRIRRAA